MQWLKLRCYQCHLEWTFWAVGRCMLVVIIITSRWFDKWAQDKWVVWFIMSPAASWMFSSSSIWISKIAVTWSEIILLVLLCATKCVVTFSGNKTFKSLGYNVLTIHETWNVYHFRFSWVSLLLDDPLTVMNCIFKFYILKRLKEEWAMITRW